MQDDHFIEIRINRRTFVATVLSLSLHLLALFLFSLKPKEVPPVDALQQPMEVSLAAPKPHEAKIDVPKESPKTFHEPKPIQKPRIKPPAAVPPQTLTTPVTIPAEISSPKSAMPVAPSPAPSPITAPPTDMMAFVNAARERRRQTEAYATDANAAAASADRGQMEEEARSANIKRNLQQAGTNGVFQIISMDRRSAMFSFRGWKNELSYSHREVYQVEIGMNGDLRREIIRKMIEIIRRYYTGDFNWDSYRLQRVVILSARPEDNAGLEDFMLQEFFGPGGATSGR